MIGLPSRVFPTAQLRRSFRVQNGGTPTADVENWNGQIAWITPEDLGSLQSRTIVSSRRSLSIRGLESSSASLAPPGSIVISTRAPIGYLGIAGVPVATNQGCRTLIPIGSICSHFYYHQLSVVIEHLNEIGQGSTFREISAMAIASFPLVTPPPNMQIAIADFLDRETARIDQLMEKKRRLIELLEEKRTALINHAVTKGLDPIVPMKDTEIPWLGEIPAHWDVMPLKRAVPSVTVGIVIQPARLYVESGDLCIRGFNVKPGNITENDLAYISRISNLEHSKSTLRAGDIVVVRTGQAGAASVVPNWADGANCVDLLLIRQSDKVASKYLEFFLNSPAAIGQVSHGSVGAIQSHFNVGALRELLVAVPPPEDQRDLIDRMIAISHALTEAIGLLRQQQEKLAEYRQALITAAVTGQIDVSSESPDPEEAIS